MNTRPIDLSPVDDMQFTWHDNFQTAIELPDGGDQCGWCEQCYGSGSEMPIVSFTSTTEPAAEGVIHPECLAQLRARRQHAADAVAALVELRAALTNCEVPGRDGALEVATAVAHHWAVIETALESAR